MALPPGFIRFTSKRTKSNENSYWDHFPDTDDTSICIDSQSKATCSYTIWMLSEPRDLHLSNPLPGMIWIVVYQLLIIATGVLMGYLRARSSQTAEYGGRK